MTTRMRRVSMIGLLAAGSVGSLAGQDPEQGGQVFRASCAQGYCHGSGGTQGRAPKLVGRNYDGAVAAKIINDGVANTGMPGFKQRLTTKQLNDVIAYVVKISGGDLKTLTASTGGGAAAGLTAQAAKGKDLFFDAQRGANRCGTCHAVEGMGTAIGPNLAASGPQTAASIRQGKAAAIRLAKLAGGTESFPALVIEQGEWMKLYDLGAVPPVLRTLAKGGVSFSGGSGWKHAEATRNYTDADLKAITDYLAWAAKQ